MPPKKQEKKADGDGPSPEEELKDYTMKNTTLELQLREKTEVIMEANQAQRAIDDEVETTMNKTMTTKSDTLQLTAEMTKQFESMEEVLVEKIALLSRCLGDLKEQLVSEEERYEAVAIQKDEEISDRDAEVLALKAKMDDMAQEFGGMLNGTLAKMNERVELSTSNTFDSDAGVRMQRN